LPARPEGGSKTMPTALTSDVPITKVFNLSISKYFKSTIQIYIFRNVKFFYSGLAKNNPITSCELIILVVKFTKVHTSYIHNHKKCLPILQKEEDILQRF
jgi:hypothetical protein